MVHNSTSVVVVTLVLCVHSRHPTMGADAACSLYGTGAAPIRHRRCVSDHWKHETKTLVSYRIESYGIEQNSSIPTLAQNQSRSVACLSLPPARFVFVFAFVPRRVPVPVAVVVAVAFAVHGFANLFSQNASMVAQLRLEKPHHLVQSLRLCVHVVEQRQERFLAFPAFLNLAAVVVFRFFVGVALVLLALGLAAAALCGCGCGGFGFGFAWLLLAARGSGTGPAFAGRFPSAAGGGRSTRIGIRALAAIRARADCWFGTPRRCFYRSWLVVVVVALLFGLFLWLLLAVLASLLLLLLFVLAVADPVFLFLLILVVAVAVLYHHPRELDWIGPDVLVHDGEAFLYFSGERLCDLVCLVENVQGRKGPGYEYLALVAACFLCRKDKGVLSPGGEEVRIVFGNVPGVHGLQDQLRAAQVFGHRLQGTLGAPGEPVLVEAQEELPLGDPTEIAVPYLALPPVGAVEDARFSDLVVGLAERQGERVA